jgi:hypothetical protein
MTPAANEFRPKQDEKAPPPGLTEDLGAVAQQLQRVARLTIDQWRLELRRQVERWTWYLGIVVVAVVIAGTGAFYLVRGTASALALALGGRGWAGDLVGGGLFLAVAVAIMGTVQWRRGRTALARLRRKYDPPASSPPPRNGDSS